MRWTTKPARKKSLERALKRHLELRSENTPGSDEYKFHDEYIVFANDRIANKENVDMLEAVAHMLDESTALEAAYAALSRIQGLDSFL